MKKGVLSNFARSHISSDRVRSGYEIKKYHHINAVLKKIHWLPVSQHIHYKMLLLTYKALNGQASSYISELLEPYLPPINLRSSAN